jgi:hypothetical protein
MLPVSIAAVPNRFGDSETKPSADLIHARVRAIE